MKWKNQGHEFDEMAQTLCDVNTKYILWGAANICRNILELCGNEAKFVGVVDSSVEKQGEKIGELTIESPDLLDIKDGSIIIVSTSAYKQVKRELLKKGYIENQDFFDYFVFLQIFMLYKKNKLYSRRLDISLTEKCNLKCKKCNMFMPYFNTPKELEKDIIMQEIDHYFNLVDYVESFNLLGGEPFLYKELENIIEYAGGKYRKRMDHFKIFTNGLLLPNNKLKELFKKYSVEIQISDYTNKIPYKKRMEEFIQSLKSEEISYVVVKSDIWGDFGFPENPNTVQDDELVDFFNKCRAPFRGLYKNRVYFCHLETSAIRAGLYKDNENDYFDLSQISENRKKYFLEFDMGFNHAGAVSFCKLCRGCDTVNSLTVTAAEQMEEKNV